MICHHKRFVFLHIPRTGGTSINKTLRPLCETPTDGNHPNPAYRTHASLSDYKSYLDEKFDSYWKFTIVRNPWDRMVSLYFWGLQIRNISASDPDHWKRYGDFNEWLKKRLVNLVRQQGVTRWGNCVNNMMIDGKMSLDFVGRFENLKEEWNHICQKIDIDLPLLHLWGTKRQHYSTYYDDESIQIVASLFEKDIQTFGYSFEEEETEREGS